MCADNRPANISELTYEQLKQMFEKDESLADVRIANFTASSVTLIYKGRHLNYELSKLSTSQRILIDELIAHEKGLSRAAAIKENEAAARAGLLREVDGVVYNLQKLTPDWVTFNNVKVLQKTDDGLLVDIAKSRYDLTLIFVKTFRSIIMRRMVTRFRLWRNRLAPTLTSLGRKWIRRCGNMTTE